MIMLQNAILSKKDLGHTVFLQRTDRIVEAQCSDNFTYEIEHIAQNLDYLKSLAQGEKLLMLNCVAPYTHISAEARVFISKGAHLNIIKAEAYVIHSLAQKLIAQFFIRVDKPIVPANYFINKKETEKWLLKFNATL